MDSLAVIDAGSEPLNGRLERFCQMLSLGFPVDQAARRAEYPEDGNPNTFAANARKRSNKPAVKLRVTWLRRNQDAAILQAKREMLEERLLLWHEVDYGQYFEMGEEFVFDKEGIVVRGADGEPKTRMVERLKPLSQLPREMRLAVKSIRWTERGKPNLELYGADDANRELRKMNGLDKQPDRDDGEGYERMSDQQLFAELARQANELGINVTLTYEGGDR